VWQADDQGDTQMAIPTRGWDAAPEGGAGLVLVVADDSASEAELAGLLAREGLAVVVGGRAALADGGPALASPDLVLLDGRGPATDIAAACAHLRAAGLGADTPVLVIGPPEDGWIAAALAAGAADLLLAPPHPALIVARVRHLLLARRLAARLQASDSRFWAAFDQTAIGMALVSPAGVVAQVNPALSQMLGYPPEALAGLHFAQYTHLDDRHLGAREMDEMQAGLRDQFSLEKRYLRNDGETIWCLLTVNVVRDAAGEPLYGVCQFQDISARKAAERYLRQSEARLAEAQRLAQLGSWTWEIASGTVHWSDELFRMVGLEPQEFDGSLAAVLAVAHPDDRPAVEAGLARLLGEGEPMNLQHRIVRADGAVRVVMMRGELVREGEGGPAAYALGTLQDVTERADAAAALREREEYLRALVEHAAEIITVADADGTVRYTSPAQARLLGYSTAGGQIFDTLHPDDHEPVRAMFAELCRTPGAVLRAEVRARHSDGSFRVFEATGTNLLANPAVRGVVINSRDITARKQAEAQLIHDAFHDSLTGLPNRALFLDRLGHALDRSTRRPDHSSAVLFLDLDRFKTVNDSLGHHAGDQLLVTVAWRLTRCVRLGDTVARFGGDEFAILLEDTAAAREATVVAERIAAAFQRPIALGGQELVISASVGIAVCGLDAKPDEVLRDADIAMYQAKRRGPGHYHVADPGMHAAIMQRLRLEAELRRAIEREEFVLHYQPKLAMDGRHVRGVEALIRWQHPARGLIAPSTFISVAEETGLIVPIGTWALRAACQQARRWRDAGLAPLYVAVNLSAQQFKQPEVATTIRAVLAEAGLDPEWLGIELTESVLMEDAAATVAALQELRNIGIEGLAIDDFGTGYSSLSYLQRFPVTAIKIDRSFVHDVTTNPSNAALVRAIIALAHSLGLATVAEGVETEAQRQFLEQAGCDRFQGFLASRPLPPEQVVTFLRALRGPGTPAASPEPSA